MPKTGKLKFYNEEKGWGFIVPDDGGKDAFFHISEVEESGLKVSDLLPGNELEYNLIKDGRTGKLKAKDLRLLSTVVRPDPIDEPVDDGRPAKRKPGRRNTDEFFAGKKKKRKRSGSWF